MMEYLEGVKKAKTLEIGELLLQAEGTEVKVNGAVHTIRDMGNVAFVILRKRDGLVQCVFEEGVTAFDLKELKEASAVEVLGTIRKEERAAHGIEIRLKEIKVLSEPDEPLPLPISKWKLNTSLEAKLNMRPISLRNVRERAKFKIQEGLVRGFRDFHAEPAEETDFCHTFYHDHHAGDKNDRLPVDTGRSLAGFTCCIPESSCKETL